MHTITYSRSRSIRLLDLIILVALSHCWLHRSAFSESTSEQCMKYEEECFRDGENAQYGCELPSIEAFVFWTGFPMENVCSNNGIIYSLLNCTDPEDKQEGECGVFVSNITCAYNGTHTYQISALYFMAAITLNSEEILCTILNNDEYRQDFIIRVGVIPDPPSNANLTITGDNEFRYDWDPPDIAPLGGICGYNLSYEGACGNCTPEGLVGNTTRSSTCTEWLALGQTCSFIVTTVTADCGFHSDPANISNVLDNTAPTNLMLELICSQNVICPDIRVMWEYSPPEVSNATILPGVHGFSLTLTDEFGNSFHSEFLDGSSVREYTFNTTEVKAAGVNGTMANISVSVTTEVGNFSNTVLNSTEGVTVNTSAALTESVCLEISINSLCSVDYRDYQVEILYSELDLPCGVATNTTGRQSLNDQYSVCIPIRPQSLCFSVAVFINGSNDTVGQTDEQSIQLLSCNTSSLNSSSSVVLSNAVSGVVINSGADVEHNETVEFGCEDSNNCNLNINQNQTRCVNGTFDPMIEQVSCDCKGTSLSVGGIVAIILIVLIFVLVVAIVRVIFLAYCIHKQRPNEQPGEDQPGEDQPGEDQPGEEQPGEEQPGEEQPIETTL